MKSFLTLSLSHLLYPNPSGSAFDSPLGTYPESYHRSLFPPPLYSGVLGLCIVHLSGQPASGLVLFKFIFHAARVFLSDHESDSVAILLQALPCRTSPRVKAKVLQWPLCPHTAHPLPLAPSLLHTLLQPERPPLSSDLGTLVPPGLCPGHSRIFIQLVLSTPSSVHLNLPSQ